MHHGRLVPKASAAYRYKKALDIKSRAEILAERTGLEPATPGVTGRYSNQLNYRSYGVPTGIRTPAAAVKGRCPRPLDDGDQGKKLLRSEERRVGKECKCRRGRGQAAHSNGE